MKGLTASKISWVWRGHGLGRIKKAFLRQEFTN